jgi:hypothetical protein
MGYGRPKAPSPERAAGPSKVRPSRLRPARRTAACVRLAAAALFAAAALAGSAVLGSCALAEKARAASFSASIASIDQILSTSNPFPSQARDLGRRFGLAANDAKTDSEWLSLLKRARASDAAGDDRRFAAIADRARKARPKSEPVAAASALAYLREGRAADAIALFRGLLSPASRPSLWAEAFAASGAKGTSGAGGASGADYARFADASGDPSAYLGAVVASLAEGDGAAARLWMGKALAAGADPSPELMWDCGLFAELSARPDAGAGAADLAVMGDAAWMAGDGALAARRWERSIALMPRRSWKPYANLALASSDAEVEASYWARLKAAFLAGPSGPERDGALGAYAAHLARQGRDAEALALLRASSAPADAPGGLALLQTLIAGRAGNEGRLAAELERLAELRPEDGEVAAAAMRELAIREMYGELAVLSDGAAKRSLESRYGWYYRAAVLAARGAFKPAEDILMKSLAKAAPEGAAAGWYALGSLYEATGDPAGSAAAFARASELARGARDRGDSLKAWGRALGESGDAAGAAKAYKAAAEENPSDAEAAILARETGARDAGGREAGVSEAARKK